MKRHLYSSGFFYKLEWFIKRFGFAELFLKPARVVLAPIIIPFLPCRKIEFCGSQLDCFYHRYNMTWACERCIEVPIVKSYVDEYANRSILEVGNVLSHYYSVNHTILDRYEKGRNVVNKDILEFIPGQKFDLIVSISTFEHIGFDDEPANNSGNKIIQAVNFCKSMLSEMGKLVFTVPIGYNENLDVIIRNGLLAPAKEYYFKRSKPLIWEHCDKDTALQCQYRKPFPYANAILVAELYPDNSVEKRT